MPGIFHAPINRKSFLATSAALAGSLWVARHGFADEDSASSAHLALLSDTHIPADATEEYRGFRPVENLQKVVAEVVRQRPKAAIINGDAARLTGQKEDYVALKGLLQSLAESAPIHIGMGNHDDRKNFFEVFPPSEKVSKQVSGKHVSTFELNGTRFVVLDSLLYVNKVAGFLGKEQRNWLEEFLNQPDEQPTVFFVHHSLGDGDGDLLDFDRLFAVLRRHRKVKALFYGHSHRYHIEQREHIYLVNQPAIGYNFNDSQPIGWLDAKFSPAGVSLTLSAIGGNLEGHGKVEQLDWA